MTEQRRIHVGIEKAEIGFERFLSAWERSLRGEASGTYLTFEDLPTLLSVMTPRRLELLRTLRQNGPLSIRALAKVLGRDYKNVHNVHTDVRSLESVGLVERTADGALNAPWDEIDARLSLVA